MKEQEVIVTHLMGDDEFVYDNVQVRCYPQAGKIERMTCGLHDDLKDEQVKEFDGVFRSASGMGDGMLMTKGDDMVIISGSQVSKDAFGKCARVAYPDGENQLLCKFWHVDDLKKGNDAAPVK